MTKNRWSNDKISKFLEMYEKYDILWVFWRQFRYLLASSNPESNLKEADTTEHKLEVSILEVKSLEVKSLEVKSLEVK